MQSNVNHQKNFNCVYFNCINSINYSQFYAVTKEITINKPVDWVFNYVRYLKNQNEFSVWANIDPKMKSTYKGTDGTVGAIAAWESNVEDVGVGEQEITKITEGKRLDFALRFKTNGRYCSGIDV